MGTLNKTGNELWAEQTASEKLDYSLDWADFGEPITQSAWVADAPVVTSDATVAGVVTTVYVTGGDPRKWYRLTNTVTGASGRSASKTIALFIKDTDVVPAPLGTALFPNKFGAVATMRRDRLVTAVQKFIDLSDDYIWEKLRVAESELQHALRVPFVPTRFLPADPTAEELAALGDMPWQIDPGYDYEPDFFSSGSWGYLDLRNRPLVSVERVHIDLPGLGTKYTIPNDWQRLDKKYAQIQFVPTSGSGSIPLNAFMLQVVSLGRRIPMAIKVTYTAGITDVERTFPELLDAARKMAVVSMLADRFLPQSGSISADGLSQSISADMDKYRDNVEDIIHGAKGRNGGLMAALHGIRVGMV